MNLSSAQIPSKYIADVMEHRFSEKYRFQAQAINLLANITGLPDRKTPDAQLIQELQERESDRCYFVLRLDEFPDSAYVWQSDLNMFVRYCQPNPYDRPKPNGDMIPQPSKWAALAWFSEEGLRQLLAWPEYQTLDETYKVPLSNRNRSPTALDLSIKCPEFEATSEPTRPFAV